MMPATATGRGERAVSRGVRWSSALLASAVALVCAPPCAAQSCQTFQALPYGTYQSGGETRELLLDLLVPASATAVPVVVWIHGGGWSSGSRTPIPPGVAALCGRGYAVASIEYRLTPTWRWPTQIQDAKGAVRWLRANAATYGLDPDRIGAWGPSAGGHLAAMLGTSGGVATATVGSTTVDLEGAVGGNLDRSSRVQAVVALYPATDFLAMQLYPSSNDHNAAASAESSLVGGPVQSRPERVATADPGTHATADDPPVLLLHGTNDDLIPFSQSVLLDRALRSHGVSSTLVAFPGAGHGFMTAASNQAAYDFFGRVLAGTPAVTVSVTAEDAAAGEAGPGTGRFRVSRSGGTGAPLAVRWAPGGTAEIGADYAAPLGAVVIPAGASSRTVGVVPLSDGLVEGSETAVLRLASDPAYRIAAGAAAATVVIADGEGGAGLPVATVWATDAAAGESGGAGAFAVELAAPAPADLTVRYRVAGTAENGVDYEALDGEVVVPAGETAAEVPVVPLADAVFEATEIVVVSLAPGRRYAIGAAPTASTASVAIAEAEAVGARPIIAATTADAAAAEPGDAGSVLLSRTGSTAGPLTVSLAVSGSAEAGVDVSPLPASVTFDAGVSRRLFTVAPLQDAQREGFEWIELAVVPEPVLRPGPRLGEVEIADDETPGHLGFYTLLPCRLVDTRGPAGARGAPALEAGAVRVFEVGGACGVPPEATAVAVTVTVVGATAVGHLSLFETGGPLPSTSTVNFTAGQARANNAVVRLLGMPPSLAVHAVLATPGTVDVIIDVTGYFR